MKRIPLSVLLALCSGGGGQALPLPRAVPSPSDMPYRTAQREAKLRERQVRVIVATAPSQRVKPSKTRWTGEPHPRHAYPQLADKKARDGWSIAAYDRSVTQRLDIDPAFGLANDPAFVRVPRTPRRLSQPHIRN